MIKSMTGFGRGESGDHSRAFTIEVKSLNHRYNDIIIKMPKYLTYLEEDIKKVIKAQVNRGRVEVYISMEYVNESDTEVRVDVPLAKSYKKVLEELNNELELGTSLTLDMITSFPDVLKTKKREEDEDTLWAALKPGLESAINKMVEMRKQEGLELAKDIEKKAESIKQLAKEIEVRAPKVIIEYKEKLWSRINTLLDEKYEIDENRLANEVAFFADRSGIDEELVRLYSHISQLTESLTTQNPIGRKLDFLIQEMNREANTIGSKVGDVEITNRAVEIKSELERIREQIQNIE